MQNRFPSLPTRSWIKIGEPGELRTIKTVIINMNGMRRIGNRPPCTLSPVVALSLVLLGQSAVGETLDLRTREGARLQIDRSWRQYKKIPSFFSEVADETERFFYLEPDGLKDVARTALVENPELKQAEAEWHALLHRVRRVSALPAH